MADAVAATEPSIRISPFREEHEQLRATIRHVVEEELAPQAGSWDETGHFPDTVFGRLGELGLLGLALPATYGGQEADGWATVVLVEELARSGVASLPLAVTAHTELVLPAVLELGTEQQRAEHLPPAVRGDAVVGIGSAGAEPSDANVGVSARRREGGWVLDGTEDGIINGLRADLLLLPARNEADRGVSLFLVDTRLPGLTLAPGEETVGMRDGGTASARLTAVEVADGAVLGRPGGGLSPLWWHRQGATLLASVAAVAAAAASFEQALSYTREREAFGRPLSRFQVLRHRLVDMATGIEACRRLVYRSLERHHRSLDVTAEAAMSRLASARTAFQVADDALQLHGGYGYSREFPVERSWRDARAMRLGRGEDRSEDVATGLGLPRLATAAASPRPRVPVAPALSDFALHGEQHEAFRTRARQFCATRISPHVDEWEAAEDFPRELFTTVGEAGFFGMKFAPRWGGTGPDLLAQAIWIEELARAGSGGIAADLGAHSDLAALYVANAGTDEQLDRWLRPSLAGTAVGALAVTEPGAGSDVAGIATRARRDGAGWRIDGSKVFITNGAWCDYVVVAAKVAAADGAGTDEPHGQLTLFVVDADQAGLTRRRMRMLGWRTSHTGELHLDGVHVGGGQRLGPVGGGFGAIMRNFAWERLSMSLGAVAAAEQALEEAVREVTARTRAGPSWLAVWRHRLADLATRVTAGRALTEHALGLHLANEAVDDPMPAPVAATELVRVTAMAKLLTQRLAFDVADASVQLHGEAGYRTAARPQRRWRDARLGPIGGGTDEIMREIVAKTFGP